MVRAWKTTKTKRRCWKANKTMTPWRLCKSIVLNSEHRVVFDHEQLDVAAESLCRSQKCRYIQCYSKRLFTLFHDLTAECIFHLCCFLLWSENYLAADDASSTATGDHFHDQMMFCLFFLNHLFVYQTSKNCDKCPLQVAESQGALLLWCRVSFHHNLTTLNLLSFMTKKSIEDLEPHSFSVDLLL